MKGKSVKPSRQRILLKLSGESLQRKWAYSKEALDFICKELVSVYKKYEIAIVIGGGNLIRGSRLKKEVFEKDIVEADYMGMLATVANSIALQCFLEDRLKVDTRVLSALEVNKVCEPHSVRRALSHLAKERIVIFAGGIGTPDFSTDTTMVIRAHEIGAEIVLKGTKVDGIFDKNPEIYEDAEFLPEISYLEYLNRELEIIDLTAVTKAMEHRIKIRPFRFSISGNLKKALREEIGSVIH